MLKMFCVLIFCGLGYKLVVVVLGMCACSLGIQSRVQPQGLLPSTPVHWSQVWGRDTGTGICWISPAQLCWWHLHTRLARHVVGLSLCHVLRKISELESIDWLCMDIPEANTFIASSQHCRCRYCVHSRDFMMYMLSLLWNTQLFIVFGTGRERKY